MRYIRTKDGIYESDKTIFGKHKKIIISSKRTNEVITEIICDYFEEKSIIEDMLFAEYCKTHKLNPLDYCRKTIVANPFIINQADTIEELCDGLIVEQKDDTSYWFVMDIVEFKEMTQEERQYIAKNWKYNAFIKTDKGLIYVAKMNESGHLELL